jgi:RNA recognition motif-containing protein
MRLIKGYRVITLPMGVGGASHYLYIKEHSEKSAAMSTHMDEGKSMDKNNSLFIGNVDYIYIKSNENEELVNTILRELFQSFGAIDSIAISKYQHQDEHLYAEKARFAHLRFMKKSSLRTALAASDQVYEEIGKSIADKFGLSSAFNTKSSSEIISHLSPYYDINPAELRDSVSKFMRDFDEAEEIKMLELKKRSEVADDDGFVLVKPR